MVGEVFIFWSKSHVSLVSLTHFDITSSPGTHPTKPCLLQNFKREEQNFVVINEINNMSFLTADSKSKMSKVSWDETEPPPPQQQIGSSVAPPNRKSQKAFLFPISVFI